MVDPNTGAKAETTEAWKDGLVMVSLRENMIPISSKSWPNINPLDVNYDNYVDSDP
jgi:hypothetical protein